MKVVFFVFWKLFNRFWVDQNQKQINKIHRQLIDVSGGGFWNQIRSS